MCVSMNRGVQLRNVDPSSHEKCNKVRNVFHSHREVIRIALSSSSPHHRPFLTSLYNFDILHNGVLLIPFTHCL